MDPTSASEATPRFSIVMPAYQAVGTVAAAVDSVRSQTYPHWELIVVDDGSDDGTAAEARFAAEGDRRVKVLSEQHRGCAGARRRAAEEARYEFITKLDADDEFVRDTLDVLARTIRENPDYDIYSANGIKRLERGEQHRALASPRFDRPVSLAVEDLIHDCWIYGGGASIRREAFDAAGGFRDGYRCEDYDLWLRALLNGARHLYVPEDIYIQHIDVPGRMNADPIPSNLSYIATLEDLERRGLLSAKQIKLAAESKTRFRRRIEQLEETGTTLAMYTDVQARRFMAWAHRRFGPRVAPVIIRIAFRLRVLARPVRLAIARRARKRGTGS